MRSQVRLVEKDSLIEFIQVYKKRNKTLLDWSGAEWRGLLKVILS